MVVETRPKWLPANFRDGEALLASYQESQRKITMQSEEIKELKALAVAREDELVAMRSFLSHRKPEPEPVVDVNAQAAQIAAALNRKGVTN